MNVICIALNGAFHCLSQHTSGNQITLRGSDVIRVALGKLFASSHQHGQIGVNARLLRLVQGACDMHADQRRQHTDNHKDHHQFQQRKRLSFF